MDDDYERWSDLFDRAWADPLGVAGLPCPSCGLRSIQFVYIVERADATDGMFALWCASCLRGFPPGYGPIPKDATVIAEAQRSQVPNYQLVVPGGGEKRRE